MATPPVPFLYIVYYFSLVNQGGARGQPHTKQGPNRDNIPVWSLFGPCFVPGWSLVDHTESRNQLSRISNIEQGITNVEADLVFAFLHFVSFSEGLTEMFHGQCSIFNAHLLGRP